MTAHMPKSIQMLQSGRLFAQRLALKAFRHLNPGDIQIAHHFTHERIRLHAFAHRGYWFRGRNRERDTMALYSRLIDPGSVVFDVGGHIGYTALYFASLVGPLGRVLVAEPAPNNLRYLRYNIRAHPTISLFEIGIGDRTERRTILRRNAHRPEQLLLEGLYKRAEMRQGPTAEVNPSLRSRFR